MNRRYANSMKREDNTRILTIHLSRLKPSNNEKINMLKNSSQQLKSNKVIMSRVN